MVRSTSGVVTQPPRVLVVDDDQDWRDVLVRILEDAGYVVTPAVNGLDALRVLDELVSPPDAILLDLMMPEMDGWELMTALESRPAVTIPIIVTSAAYDARLDGTRVPLLRKPVDLDQLLALVAESVAARRLATVD